ncbi:MAG: hypothetical protein GX928_00425 [Ruminococcaceae bacterium]|nr:hypothetical protein [Oscillospiraceae bacterium]
MRSAFASNKVSRFADGIYVDILYVDENGGVLDSFPMYERWHFKRFDYICLSL